VKKETEEYKYPPIVHIENKLNHNILEDVDDELDDGKNQIKKMGNQTMRAKVQTSKAIDICRVSPMLTDVVHNNTYIPKKSSIYLKFKHDHLFQNPSLGRSESSTLLSPDHIKRLDQKVSSRMDKLTQLFRDTATSDTKQKSHNYSPLTLQKSPETFH
jgi:hypothetical protein